MRETGHDAGALVHTALAYQSAEHFLAETGAYVARARAAGRPVLVAVPEPRLGMLRDHLGPTAADQVCFVDMATEGRNPGRIIPEILRPFVSEHRGHRPAVVGEPVWPERSPQERAAGVQHEALINLAFDECVATILCLYNGSGLDPAILADACRTHPTIQTDGAVHTSPSYGDPATVAATANASLREPPTTAVGLTFRAEDLGEVRQLVLARARAAGLDRERAAELQLAVSEVAANVSVHTNRPGDLRVWHDGSALVCEVRDRGRLIDLLAGRREPAVDSPGGRGLLIANRLCDLVQIDPGPDGTTVRLHVGLAAPEPPSTRLRGA